MLRILVFVTFVMTGAAVGFAQVSFTEVSTTLPHMWKSVVAVADLDKDGDLDVVMTGSTSSDGATAATKVFRNDGGFTFTERTTSIPGVYMPAGLALGDYDKDGDADVLIIGRNSSGGLAKVYRNDGNFTFADAGIALTAPDANAGSSYGAWADLDGDGDLDIVLAGTGSGDQVMLYVNASGSFTKATQTFNAGTVAAPGDYDKDGRVDLFVCGASGSATNGTLYRNSGGTSYTPVTSGMEGYADGAYAAWGDFDGDGDLDLGATGWTGSGNSRKAHVYRNDGGTFTKLSTPALKGVDRNGFVAWADVSGDGKKDLFIGGFHLDQVGPVSAFYTSPTFEAGPTLRPSNHGLAAIADLDGDGDQDVILTGTSDDMLNRSTTDNFRTVVYRNGAGGGGGGGGTSKCTWDGTWSTNWGTMVLHQVADSVWGTYTHDNGRINGKVNGSTLTGVWSEAPSYKPSGDAGDISFTLNQDCRTFSGNWRYGIGGSTWSGGWSGERSGFSVTGRITLNGKGLAGVEVRAGSVMGVTDANGYFTVNGVSNGTLTITPIRQGVTFEPASMTVTVNNTNTVDVNFTASAGGGQGPGDGCDKTIIENTPSWAGDFYPNILTGTNAIATAREANGTIHVLYSVSPGYIYHRKSTNNGVLWSDPIRIESEPNASGTNALLIGSDGVLHAGNQFNVGAYYKRSTDGGTTWTAPFYLHDQGWGDWDYSAHLAFDTQGRLHAVYYAAHGWSDPPFNVKHRISTDGGITWEPETPVTSIPNEDARGQGATSPVLVAGPNNMLYMAYFVQTSVSPDRWKLVMRTWSGWPWADEITVAEGITTTMGADLAVDGAGTLHMVYTMSTREGDAGPKQLVYRTYANNTLGAPRTIGDESKTWYVPSIGFANGKVMIAAGTMNYETKRGAGIYVYNVTDNWPCPVLVSKSTEAMVVNIPWTYHDRKPAGTNDITWVEQFSDRAELVLCDLASFTQRPCDGGGITEGPAPVTTDSVNVSLTSIETDAVGNPGDFPVVDMTVTVGQQRVGMLGDLTYENFSVYEDGVRQTFSMMAKSAAKAGENDPAAAAVVIDGSTGIPDSTKTKLIELVQGLAENMKPNWRISIFKYSDRVQQMAGFSNNVQDLIAAAIAPGPTGEEAVIMSAITEAVDKVAREPEVYKTVIVVTSGRITDPQYTAFATQNAVAKGIPIFVLGVTDIKADPSLRALADRTGGRMYTQGDDIDEANEGAAATLGNAYRLRYTTTNQKRDGTTRNVKVVLTAPLKDKPTTTVTDDDAKTYRAPVNTSDAVVFVDAEETALPPAPGTATIALGVKNITDGRGLMGAEIEVTFDPAQVELVGHRAGEFLSPPPLDILSDLSNFSGAASGTVTINVVRVGGNPAGVQGSGPLYYLTFKAKSASARSLVHIASVRLRNAQNANIAARIRDGELVSATAQNGPGAGVGSVFTNNNDADAKSGSALPATFQINEPYVITRVQTLHAGGKTPGTIRIQNTQTGQTFGPWQATGHTRGTTANAMWTVDINETLQPGSYDVIDSDPSSWTFNAESDYRGICWVDGKKVTSDKPTDHRGVLLGDFDGNNAVNFGDYTLFVSYWNVTERKGDLVSAITGEPPGMPPYMVETYPYRPDGLVNFEDQIVFAQMYNWTRGLGKRDDPRTVSATPLTLRVSDVALITGERELRVDGVSAERLLGLQLAINATPDVVRAARMNVGSLLNNERTTPSAFFDTRRGDVQVSLAGLTESADGVSGSGGILRMRYRPHTNEARPTLTMAEARDIFNRRIDVVYATETPVDAPVTIVPTPAGTSVTLTVRAEHWGEATATVTDITGRVVTTWTCALDADGTGRASFTVTDLPQGAYMVTVDVGGHRATVPMLIVR